MNGRSGILGAGNWIVDTTKIIDVFPSQDALANVLQEERNNGGGAFNVLVDLAKLGAGFPLQAAGLIGRDSEGDWIIEQCRTYGIDTSLLARHETAHTSYTDVMTVRSTGRRTFFHQRGANRYFAPEHLIWERIQGGIFYLGYLLLLDTMDAINENKETTAVEVLREAGRRSLYRVVDLVSVERPDYADVVAPSLPHIDMLICNELEASRVTGVSTKDSADRYLPDGLCLAAKTLLESGVQDWVIIHLPEGAYARSRIGKEIWQGSVRLPADQIAGASGAGDAFAAGLLYGLHHGWDMRKNLELGVCAAASSLMGVSTSGSVLPKEQCLALGNNYGYMNLL